MRFFLALLVIALIAAPLRARADAWRGVPVFMYHKINPIVPSGAVGHDLTLTPDQFEAQLRYLRAARVRTLTASELVAALERGEAPRRAAVLTFDDGYADNATYALPLLRQYGVRATFFIITGTIGTPNHLSWRQLRALRDAGMEIAAHGTRHIDLTELGKSGQRGIAGGCILKLTRFLGVRPQVYAYPGGAYNATTLSVMREAGLKAAFTSRPGYVASLRRRYELPRFRVHHADAERFFARFFGGRVPTARRPTQVEVNAAARSAGNRKAAAVALARILLAREWPAQLVKIRLDGVGSHLVAGLILAGTKFHRPLTRADFSAEVASLVERTLANSRVEEVDVWTTVPLAAPVGSAVSGDMAVPTSKIVFSVTVRRGAAAHGGVRSLLNGRAAFWDPGWLASLAPGAKGRSSGGS